MIVEIIPYLLFFVKLLLIGLSVIFLISGFDELFMDLVYLFRSIYRKLFVYRRFKRLSEEQLLTNPEKNIAIMIPCWDESAVIRRMLSNTFRTLNYNKFWIFVGTYPNDPDTRREVELTREIYPNIHRIVTPKDGPTNKADCLNWIYEGIKVFEKDNNMTFDIFVMNDSEDIVHPMYLKLLNYLIPQADMVQIPVFPLPSPWWNLTRGHYMDEFAETHTRDMIVREILTGCVPSAGVGSGYSRKALKLIAADNNNQLFNIESLTEDYDFGLRMQKFGLRQIFVRQFILRRAGNKNSTGGTSAFSKREYIGIREFFPGNLGAAVRQKSRWVMGIALQGWEKLGWPGGFWGRYMLFRDRKALITNQVNMLGNMVVPIIVFIHLLAWFDPAHYNYPTLVRPGTLLWTLLIVNLFFLLWRIMWRFIHVGYFYGPWHMLLSPVRMLWGNWINFLATLRALKLYRVYLRTGEVIKWDKTDHAYPSEDELRSYRRKLGDLLLASRFITVQQLDEALEKQKENGLRLGEILLDTGSISEDKLRQVLDQQFHKKRQSVPKSVVSEQG